MKLSTRIRGLSLSFMMASQLAPYHAIANSNLAGPKTDVRGETQASAAQSFWAALTDHSSDLSKVLDVSEIDEIKINEKLKAILEKPIDDVTVGKENNADEGKKLTRAQIELNKLRIEIPIEPAFNLGGQIRVKVAGKRKVEATNIAGEQMLTDTYLVSVGSTKILKAGGRVLFTFSRRFSGPNAKSEALFYKYRPWKKVPRNAKEIAEKLDEKETVRIEFFGNLGLGKDYENVSGSLKATGGIGYENQALFLVDIYRKSVSEVQTRFMGMLSRGIVSASLGTRFGIEAPGRLGTALTIGAKLKGSFSNPFADNSGADTMMVGYRFNLASPEAVNALDEIFNKLKTLKFIQMFNPTHDASNLGEELLGQAVLAEKYAKEDQGLPEGQQRVEHQFRGRMTTKYFKVGPEANLSVLAGFEAESGSSETFVRRFGADNKLEYYLLESTHKTWTRQVGARIGFFDRRTHDMDLLVTSNEKRDFGAMIELVNRTEWQDNKFNRDTMQNKFKKGLRMTLPQSLLSDQALNQFFPDSNQNSATFSYEARLTPEALKTLQRYSDIAIAAPMTPFLENHPEKSMMNLPSFNVGENGNMSLGEYTANLGKGIQNLVMSDDGKTFQEAFGRLKKDLVFQDWIIGQFVPTLLPEQNIGNIFGVKLQLASDELKGVKQLSLGNSKSSNIYQAVKFMRRVLEEDRGLKLQLDEIAKNGTK